MIRSVHVYSLTTSIFLVVATTLAGCHNSNGDNVRLNGAGATFPYPLYSKWVSDYAKIDPSVSINYQSIGSGGGIRQISEGTVDFGATDTPMSDEQLTKTPQLVHIPLTLGAVAVVYDIGKMDIALKLSPEVLAGIFLGTISKWNAPEIAAINPGAKLPDQNIAVVHRSDGSGTTAVFTDYLSKVSPVWKEKVGTGTSVNWPVGIGAKGNEGVAGAINTTPGAIAYVELAYAEQNKFPFASLRNKNGRFVAPAAAAVTKAADGFTASMPDDFRQSIVDGEAAGAYPISSFSFVLVYSDNKDAKKGEALAHFLWWAIHDGQAVAPSLSYAPLPADLVGKIEKKLLGLTANGQVLLKDLGPAKGQ